MAQQPSRSLLVQQAEANDFRAYINSPGDAPPGDYCMNRLFLEHDRANEHLLHASSEAKKSEYLEEIASISEEIWENLPSLPYAPEAFTKAFFEQPGAVNNYAYGEELAHYYASRDPDIFFRATYNEVCRYLDHPSIGSLYWPDFDTEAYSKCWLCYKVPLLIRAE